MDNSKIKKKKTTYLIFIDELYDKNSQGIGISFLNDDGSFGIYSMQFSTFWLKD